MYNIGIQSKEADEDRSEPRKPVCQLEGDGGEDEAQVAAILEIAGTEERRSEFPVGKHPLADRLCDRGLARPGEPVQPEYRGLVEVVGPRLDLVQHCLPCPFETAASAAMAIPCSLCATAALQLR